MKYDLNKPIIILATGPSAVNIKKSDKYYVCGLNLSSRLIEETDIWLVNDANILNDFDANKLKSIKKLVLPEFPHSVMPKIFTPFENLNYLEVTKHLPKSLEVDFFNIQTANKFNYNKDVPMFNVNTSGESAIRWVNYLKFKKIILLGFDPNGGRSDLLKGRGHGSDAVLTKKFDPPKRYADSFNVILQVGMVNNMQIIKLQIDGDEMNEKIFDTIDWDFKKYKEINI